MSGREKKVQAVIESLETDMELIGVTGVEDKLQENVQPTLEMLRNAGIKIWMLTGDKVETATWYFASRMLVDMIALPFLLDWWLATKAFLR